VVLGQQKKSAFVTEPRPLLWGQNLVIRGWLGDVGAHARAGYDPGFGPLLQVLCCLCFGCLGQSVCIRPRQYQGWDVEPCTIRCWS